MSSRRRANRGAKLRYNSPKQVALREWDEMHGVKAHQRVKGEQKRSKNASSTAAFAGENEPDHRRRARRRDVVDILQFDSDSSTGIIEESEEVLQHSPEVQEASASRSRSDNAGCVVFVPGLSQPLTIATGDASGIRPIYGSASVRSRNDPVSLSDDLALGQSPNFQWDHTGTVFPAAVNDEREQSSDDERSRDIVRNTSSESFSREEIEAVDPYDPPLPQHLSKPASDALPVFTWEEILQHNKLDNCWIVLRGKVYDITEYARYHPGGLRAFERWAGRDATENIAMHSNKMMKLASRYCIGRLEGAGSSCCMQ